MNGPETPAAPRPMPFVATTRNWAVFPLGSDTLIPVAFVRQMAELSGLPSNAALEKAHRALAEKRAAAKKAG